jgi:hypothetical protein
MLDCIEEIEKVIDQACSNTYENQYNVGVMTGLKSQLDAFKRYGIEAVKTKTREYYCQYIKELKQYRKDYDRGYKDGLIKGEKILLDIVEVTC